MEHIKGNMKEWVRMERNVRSYNEIFQQNNYGFGQAKAIIFFICVAAITLVQVSITKKREVEM